MSVSTLNFQNPRENPFRLFGVQNTRKTIALEPMIKQPANSICQWGAAFGDSNALFFKAAMTLCLQEWKFAMTVSDIVLLH